MVENAKTIMERFGFKDPSLTTPEHDKILLWLNSNWKNVLCELKLISEEKLLGRINVVIELPVMNGNCNSSYKQNIGFVDFFVDVFGLPLGSFYFEIKPTIFSIGETIRQIQFYRSHRDGVYIIVTKTKGLKELFAQQNIFIYEYEEE